MKYAWLKYQRFADPALLSYLVLKILGFMLPYRSRERCKYLFKYIHYRKHIESLLKIPMNEDDVLFSIVHLNAPDFLLLALEFIRRLYPEKPLVVLDNGSYHSVLMKVVEICKKYRCGLLYNNSNYKDHVLAIQYLIDYSIKLGKKFLVILDNDVMLVSRIDDILKLMEEKGFVVAGPQDLVKANGRYFRFAPLAVHASMLILKPADVVALGGRYCSFNYIITKYSRTPEPYHSIAYACLKRVLYLKPVMIDELFPLTAYIFKNRVVGYHAWYSSRVRISRSTFIDNLSIEFLKARQKQIKKFFIDKLRSLRTNR